jgi:hypothetical protein
MKSKGKSTGDEESVQVWVQESLTSDMVWARYTAHSPYLYLEQASVFKPQIHDLYSQQDHIHYRELLR